MAFTLARLVTQRGIYFNRLAAKRRGDGPIRWKNVVAHINTEPFSEGRRSLTPHPMSTGRSTIVAGHYKEFQEYFGMYRYELDLSGCGAGDDLTCIKSNGTLLPCDQGHHFDDEPFTETIVTEVQII